MKLRYHILFIVIILGLFGYSIYYHLHGNSGIYEVKPIISLETYICERHHPINIYGEYFSKCKTQDGWYANDITLFNKWRQIG